MPQTKSTCLHRLCLWLCCILFVNLGLSQAAQGATVGVGTAPCTFVIEGPISEGDFEQLAAFRGEAQFWSETGYGLDPVLCLNSEGGSLVEGGKIARFVYEKGLQTRIEDGSKCYSVCAIIFMMGNKHSGPTTVEENRTLHIGGDLAFHSPSILIDSTQRYGAAELKLAYALALESVLNILDLANSQRPFEAGAMMHPGLIRALLDTPASALFHISTIEQALSWDIGLEGVPEYLPQFSIQRQMVCENGLMRGFRRPSEIYDRSDNNFMSEQVFKLTPLSRSAAYRLVPDYSAADIEEGIVYGFRYWALPMECRVRIDSGQVQVCGHDSNFNHGVGDCHANRFIPLPDYARYHPLTEFKTLRTARVAADVLRSARCTLRSAAGTTLRNELCTQAITVFQRGDRKFAAHTLHWQNGDRTLIEIATNPGFGVDGAPDIYRTDGAEAKPHGDLGTCLRTSGSASIVCVTDP